MMTPENMAIMFGCAAATVLVIGKPDILTLVLSLVLFAIAAAFGVQIT